MSGIDPELSQALTDVVLSLEASTKLHERIATALENITDAAGRNGGGNVAEAIDALRQEMQAHRQQHAPAKAEPADLVMSVTYDRSGRVESARIKRVRQEG